MKKEIEYKAIDALCDQFADQMELKKNEPMALHTTFRVGGPAAYFVTPKTKEALKAVLCCCKENEIPCYIIGNGSNLLVSDYGYEGVIVRIYDTFTDCVVEGDRIIAGAGVLLSKLANKAKEASLSGLEFASGIPGTLGGAVFMNAGAYNGEMAFVVESVEMMTKEGEILCVAGSDMKFGYRESLAEKKDYIVLGATIKLEPKEQALIRERMAELAKQRSEKQPLEYPSAGSTFKRPVGYFAGKLIQDAGLSGYRVGGACVSTKHCGFVVNDHHATAKDIIDVVEHVKETVKEQFGVSLEMEVKLLGEF